MFCISTYTYLEKESNLHLGIRSPSFYPLNYRGIHDNFVGEPRIGLGPHAPKACILPLYYSPDYFTEWTYGESNPDLFHAMESFYRYTIGPLFIWTFV